MTWVVVCQLVGSQRSWVVGRARSREEAEKDRERAERKSPACYTYRIEEGSD